METTELTVPYVLPRDLFRRALVMLRQVLPPPLIGDPADTTQRDMDAMAEVAAMRPADAVETALAAQFVAANALAFDIMAVITESPVDAMKHWAASGAMFRQSHAALAALGRVQAARMRQARGAESMRRRSDTQGTEARVQPPQPDAMAEAAQAVCVAETISQIDSSETPTRRETPPAFVPDPEIISQLVADETLMRRLKAKSSIPAGRHSSSPARSVPYHEMVSHVPGYEMDMRHVASAPGASAAPGGPGVRFIGRDGIPDNGH
jgi:hypothetical protein